MLKSLYLYSRNILLSLPGQGRSVILDDLRRYPFGKPHIQKVPEYPPQTYKASLDAVMGWLETAGRNMKDDGIGSYHLADGWSSSYPETTGYIIPTLMIYGIKYEKPEMVGRALKAASWLVSVQKESGGWQGGRMDDNMPEVVFNTGQVIRGLLAAYQYDRNEAFLESITKACDWLCRIQHPGGFWKEHASMSQARVYDSFVDVPLIRAGLMTGNQQYVQAAIKNLEWIVRQKQTSNGWFQDCDNTVKHNDRPILHTIAYTLDGLIDCGEILFREDFTDAARRAADMLLKLFLFDGRLHGRYDRNWKGSEYFICTGGAQMAIVWLKLYRITLEECYMEAAGRMLDLLIFIQDRKIPPDDTVNGAIPGSFPVWGKYESFAFPNWASKFMADALMMHLDLHEEVAK
jgi:hypothetical protein